MVKYCEKCNEDFTNKVPNIDISVDIRSRKNCWKCSPYGNSNRKVLEKRTSKICSKCKEDLSIENFYTKSSTGNRTRTPYCKKCQMNYNLQREIKRKIQMIEYKGGKCIKCGYNKNIAALDFHHLESDNKDFNIAHVGGGLEKMKKELDKCILVCSNCHREIHNPNKNNLL